jgi:hypothetical protein
MIRSSSRLLYNVNATYLPRDIDYATTSSSACSPSRRDDNHRPHFHASYQDDVGIFAIDTLAVVGGKAELLAAWNRLQAGRLPGKIEPLR